MTKGKRATNTPEENFNLNLNDSDISNLNKLVSRVIEEATKDLENKGIVMNMPVVLGFNINIDAAAQQSQKNLQNKPGQQTTQLLVDLIDRENDITIIAEMPGIRKEEISVKVNNEAKTAEINAANMARPYRALLQLPHVVNEKKAKFDYRNGILELVLPKR
jgi:HSP20 family molecular chaperone IbpA